MINFSYKVGGNDERKAKARNRRRKFSQSMTEIQKQERWDFITQEKELKKGEVGT